MYKDLTHEGVETDGIDKAARRAANERYGNWDGDRMAWSAGGAFITAMTAIIIYGGITGRDASEHGFATLVSVGLCVCGAGFFGWLRHSDWRREYLRRQEVLQEQREDARLEPHGPSGTGGIDLSIL